MKPNERTLQQQRIEFANSSFLATPIAGLIAWLVIGIAALVLPIQYVVWTLFIATGSIVYLGMFISKFTGENFLDKKSLKTNSTNSSCSQWCKHFWYIPLRYHFS